MENKNFQRPSPPSLLLFVLVLASILWGDCSTCETDLSPEWKCPATVEAYNGLLGNPGGTAADIIEAIGPEGGLGHAYIMLAGAHTYNRQMTVLHRVDLLHITQISIL